VTAIRITRAGPLTTVQDAGRFGMLRHGISASGPMDRGAFERAAGWMGGAGRGGVEFTTAGIGFVLEGPSVSIGLDGGSFKLAVNGEAKSWPARIVLKDGDEVEITPGEWGNYGYLRFDRELDLPALMGSIATSSVAGIGGFAGRRLQGGDAIPLGDRVALGVGAHPRPVPAGEGPIRLLWGLHADLFDAAIRSRFTEAPFAVSTRIDRMGARLDDGTGVFAEALPLSLVSDAIVPGDVQILGDRTPIVLLRDHQPTGGYPRIATVITADLDRFAQLRPGAGLRFEAISLDRAHSLLKGRG
jgi:5-oxoprolinase (ATP-hydrolysing) subunit C